MIVSHIYIYLHTHNAAPAPLLLLLHPARKRTPVYAYMYPVKLIIKYDDRVVSRRSSAVSWAATSISSPAPVIGTACLAHRSRMAVTVLPASAPTPAQRRAAEARDPPRLSSPTASAPPSSSRAYASTLTQARSVGLADP